MKYYTRIGDEEHEFTFRRHGGRLTAHTPDGEHAIDLSMIGDGSAFSLLVDGRSHDFIVERVDGGVIVQWNGERVRVVVRDERERAAEAVKAAGGGGPQQLFATMPGVVVDVLVAAGDSVEAGQTLVVLEAMKMQNPLCADGPGTVARVLVAKGQAVAGGALLVEVE